MDSERDHAVSVGRGVRTRDLFCLRYGVSLLPPSLRHRTAGIALNLTGHHCIDFLSSANDNIIAERSSKRPSSKAVTARITQLPKLVRKCQVLGSNLGSHQVCRPMSGSSKHCLLRWEGGISISIAGDTGGSCELSIADPSTGSHPPLPSTLISLQG